MSTSKVEPNEDLLNLLNVRVSLGRKFSKNNIEDIKKWEKDYNITTIHDAKFTNLDNQIQIPYIFSTVESGTANLFEKFPSIIMKQRGKEDREFTDFSEQVWEWLKDKLGLEEKVEDAGMTFLNDGQVSSRYGWNPETIEIDMPVNDPATGQPVIDPLTGQPTTQKVTVPAKNYPYLCNLTCKTIFFSPESKFVLDDEENLIPYAYWVEAITKDAAEEQYGITVEDEELETIKMDEIEKPELGVKLTPDEQLRESDDLKRVKIYSYVGVLPKDKITDKDLKANHKSDFVYYTVFTKKKIISQPIHIEKKPILNLGHYGLSSTFFRFGEAKILRELEQDISLGRSRIMDLRDRQGTKIGVPQGTEFDEDSFKKSRDYTFMRFIGNNPPQYINPPPIPDTIMASIQMSRDDVQMTSATMDISRAGDTNTVNTATGQKIFSGETQKRNGKKKKKIARYLRAIAKNLLVLCGQNWDEDIMSKITDIPAEVIKQQGWKQKLADLGNDYDVDIDIDSMGDTKETDAANSIAMYREMKDSPYVNQEELIKWTFKTGFKQKDSDRFMSSYVSPDTIMSVVKYLLENQILQQEDAQMIVDKLDMMMAEQQQSQTGQPAGGVGANEGRPPTASPTAIVKKSMPGSNATQMTAQRQAAYKQTNVPKGPQK